MLRGQLQRLRRLRRRLRGLRLSLPSRLSGSVRALLRATGVAAGALPAQARGLRWALSPGRRPGRAALLSVGLFGTWRGWLDFMCVYAWFRWADDRIDCRERGGPEIQAFVREQSRLMDGLLEGPPGGADLSAADAPALALALALRPPIPPVLARSVRGMWAALCADAARDGEPVEEGLLLTQIRRVGDAYTDALLHACGADGGQRGDGPARSALYALARAATAVHHLRDLMVDREIGYLNVPLPWAALLGIDPVRFTDVDVREIARWRAPLIRADFAAGAAALPGLPWRARWLLRLFAWRYMRALDRCVK